MTQDECVGCIYYNIDSEKCRRFGGKKVGFDEKGNKYCIVRDGDGININIIDV